MSYPARAEGLVNMITISLIKKQKRICGRVDFVFLENHRVKINESKKKNIYMSLARELKKCNKKKKKLLIPVIAGALEMAQKSL